MSQKTSVSIEALLASPRHAGCGTKAELSSTGHATAHRADPMAGRTPPPAAPKRDSVATTTLDFDVLVIGSGYGGSFAALELAKSGCSICVMERGNEYQAGDFPETLGDLPGHVQVRLEPKDCPADSDKIVEPDRRGFPDALFNLTGDEDALVLTGVGLGGTSLINASVVLPPTDAILDNPLWPSEVREDRAELQHCFHEVRTLLGARPFPNPQQFAKYRALDALIRRIDDLDLSPADIAVTSSSGPNAVGVEQSACIHCGNCVTGCNHRAKNVLPMNVIPLAASRGVQFVTGATALRILRFESSTDTSALPRRWSVEFARTETLRRHDPDRFQVRAHLVIVAAGTLGSTELLIRSQRESGLSIDESTAATVESPPVPPGDGYASPPTKPLRFSSRLGRRFSGNADFLAFGYAQANPVEAVAEVLAPVSETQTEGYRPVGPTILGVARPRRETPPYVSVGAIEDAAVPSALNTLIGTLLGLTAMPHGFVDFDLPGLLRQRPDIDPMSNHPATAAHAQVILGMGYDRADGCLELDAHGRLRIRMPKLSTDWGLVKLYQTLNKATQARHPLDSDRWQRIGFDQGYFMPNPLWKPLPPGSAEVAGDIRASTIIVHPLGGCVMGANVSSGVVDQLGTVFDPSGDHDKQTHAGLHVLDGAIVPLSLGANPLLMISALALRAARVLREQLEAARQRRPATSGRFKTTVVAGPDLTWVAERYRKPLQRPFAVAPNRDMMIEFQEVLHTGEGIPIDARLLRQMLTPSMIERLANGRAGVTMRWTVRAPLFEWLAKPHTAWKGTVELGTYDFSRLGGLYSDLAMPEAADRYPHATGFGDDSMPASRTSSPNGVETQVSRTARRGAQRQTGGASQSTREPVFIPFARGDGEVRILDLVREIDAQKAHERLGIAGGAYLSPKRARDFSLRQMPPSPDSADPPVSIGGRISYWLRGSEVHALWRSVEYRAKLTGIPVTPGGVAPELLIDGQKTMSFTPESKNIWDSLIELQTRVEVRDLGSMFLPMSVDLLALLRKNIFQIDGATNTPHTVAGLIGVAAQWIKSILSTNYWSFRGFDYGPIPRPEEFAELSDLTLRNGTKLCSKVESFMVPRRPTAHPPMAPASAAPDDKDVDLSLRGGTGLNADNESIRLRLSRYTGPMTHRGPLLLIHGLAHGGEVFTTDTIDYNMAAYFVDEGFDVFVMDNRMSNFLGKLSEQPTNIDEIGLCDIPAAVDKVIELYQSTQPPSERQKELQIQVFAHCIGAAAFSIAALSGKLNYGADSSAAGRSRSRSKIKSAILHAVNPWVVPSKWNRISSAIAALYRDAIGNQVIDPIPPPESKAFDQIIDRLAASIPWPDDELELHRQDRWPGQSGFGICNRMTLFYGREWVHANLDPRTQKGLHRLVGPTHLDMFKHVFFMVFRQRLTDHNGENAYLHAQNLRNHWTFPTLFACGAQNKVFAPESSARAFLALTAILNGQPIDSRPPAAFLPSLYIAPDVGHMDFLFGRHAAKPDGRPDGPRGAGIYAKLVSYLTDPQGFSSDAERQAMTSKAIGLDPDFIPDGLPLVGPIFNYAIGPIVEPGKVFPTVSIGEFYELRPYLTASLSKAEPAPQPGIELNPFLQESIREFKSIAILDNQSPPQFVEGALSRFDPFVHNEWLLDFSRPMSPTLESRIEHTLQPSALEPFLNDRLRQFFGYASLANSTAVATSAPAPVPDYIQLSTRLAGQPWFENLRRWLANPTDLSRISMLAMSCRWPGLGPEHKAQASFESRMVEQLKQAGGIDALWLLGDQIYADAMADLFDVTESTERAAQRYRQAFSGDSRLDESYESDAFQELLASAPSWMLLDDHELHDDVQVHLAGHERSRPRGTRRLGATDSKHCRPEEHRTETIARRLNMAHRFESRRAVAKSSGEEVRFWLDFQVLGLPCFMLDTRTARKRRTHVNWTDCQMIGADQIGAFESWLARRPYGSEGLPRFILSSSAFGVPYVELAEDPALALRRDGWEGYPASMRWLFNCLLDSELSMVVMVGGDLHLSMTSEIVVTRRRDQRSMRILSLVASGLNSPLPFANTRRTDIIESKSDRAWVCLYDDGVVRAVTRAHVVSDAFHQFSRIDLNRHPSSGTWNLTYKVFGEDPSSTLSSHFDLGAEAGRAIIKESL